MEEYIGRPLFERKAGVLRPLSDAEAKTEALTRAFRSLSASLSALNAPEGHGSIAVTTTHSLAEFWLSSILPDFHAQTGHLNLRLETSFDIIDLEENGLDFAIRLLGDPESDVATLPLFPEVFAPLATKDFAKRHGLDRGTKKPCWRAPDQRDTALQ